MDIIRATAYPSRYAERPHWDKASIMERERSQPEQNQSPPDWPRGWPQYTERPEDACTGSLRAPFNVAGAQWNTATDQCDIASAWGCAMDAKPVYQRHERDDVYDRGEYTVCGRLVHEYFVKTELYAMNELPVMLKMLQALAECGYAPNGAFMFYSVPERFDVEMTFSLPLNAFSLPIIETCACLLCQVSAMAMDTKRAFFDDAEKQKAKDQRRQRGTMQLM